VSTEYDLFCPKCEKTSSCDNMKPDSLNEVVLFARSFRALLGRGFDLWGVKEPFRYNKASAAIHFAVDHLDCGPLVVRDEYGCDHETIKPFSWEEIQAGGVRSSRMTLVQCVMEWEKLGLPRKENPLTDLVPELELRLLFPVEYMAWRACGGDPKALRRIMEAAITE